MTHWSFSNSCVSHQVTGWFYVERMHEFRNSNVHGTGQRPLTIWSTSRYSVVSNVMIPLLETRGTQHEAKCSRKRTNHNFFTRSILLTKEPHCVNLRKQTFSVHRDVFAHMVSILCISLHAEKPQTAFWMFFGGLVRKKFQRCCGI